MKTHQGKKIADKCNAVCQEVTLNEIDYIILPADLFDEAMDTLQN